MLNQEPMGVAIVGTGRIAEHYGKSLATSPEKVRIVGAFDAVPNRAEAFVGKYGGRRYGVYEELLDDEDVDIVLNLTVQQVHADVTTRALEAGKHVHSEKPLACSREDGTRLVCLAEEKGLRLSCAPFKFLGEAQQTCIKALRNGSIGKPLVAYAEMDTGPIERWNPRPIPFLQEGAGPLLDVGVYPLTFLTAALGPVVRVVGVAHIVQPIRTIATGPDKGTTFEVETPDQVVGCLEFECGAVGRVTASFRSGKSRHGHVVEFHGEQGTLYLAPPTKLDATLEHYDYDTDAWRAVPYVKEPAVGEEWGRGVFDLVDSLQTGRVQHCTGRHAYHVLDICLGILESSEAGRPVEVTSSFELPPLMPWAACSHS